MKVKWVVRRTKEKGGRATRVWAENVGRKFSTGAWRGKCEQDRAWGLPWHRRISAAPVASAGEQGGIMRGSIWLYSKLPSTLFLFSPARCPPHP